MGRGKSFTLVELLAVIVIIMIIAGMILGVSSSAISRAKQAKAEAMIGSLSVAIRMYNADTGQWPGGFGPAGPTGSSSEDLYWGLVAAGGGIPGWNGPYMDFKDEALTDCLGPPPKIYSGIPDIEGDDDDQPGILDPWKNQYQFRFYGEDHTYLSGGVNPDERRQPYNLWSYGPDGPGGDVTKWLKSW